MVINTYVRLPFVDSDVGVEMFFGKGRQQRKGMLILK